MNFCHYVILPCLQAFLICMHCHSAGCNIGCICSWPLAYVTWCCRLLALLSLCLYMRCHASTILRELYTARYIAPHELVVDPLLPLGTYTFCCIFLRKNWQPCLWGIMSSKKGGIRSTTSMHTLHAWHICTCAYYNTQARRPGNALGTYIFSGSLKGPLTWGQILLVGWAHWDCWVNKQCKCEL